MTCFYWTGNNFFCSFFSSIAYWFVFELFFFFCFRFGICLGLSSTSSSTKHYQHIRMRIIVLLMILLVDLFIQSNPFISSVCVLRLFIFFFFVSFCFVWKFFAGLTESESESKINSQSNYDNLHSLLRLACLIKWLFFSVSFYSTDFGCCFFVVISFFSVFCFWNVSNSSHSFHLRVVMFARTEYSSFLFFAPKKKNRRDSKWLLRKSCLSFCTIDIENTSSSEFLELH